MDKLERLVTEYGPPPLSDNDSKEQESQDQVKRHRAAVLQQKGPEWLELFGDQVNDDDDFRLGLSLNPKRGGTQQQRTDATDTNVSVKLFTDFFKSDIILASPLGLKMTMTASANDEDDKYDDDNKYQADFLSSIEICLLMRSDVLLMQNWDHVTDVLALLNQQPKHTNMTDFSRVRPYLLDGHAAQYRQLLMVAPFLDPALLSTFKRHAHSRAGQVRLRRRVVTEHASIAQVLLPTRQVFQRVAASSFATQSQDRLEYFCRHVLSQLLQNNGKQQAHTLIYIPSYFEFVALRNVLLKREFSFVSVTEYSRTTEISRGRARFLQGRKPWMLYTGRAHFFHRHAIKGFRHVIFFGPPEHAQFYHGHVNLLGGGLEASRDEDDVVQARESCLVLYTRYESHALERIVGSTNCSRMVKGKQSTFVLSV